MNKKIKHRILYFTVALLWGVAIYRTYQNYQVDDETQLVESSQLNITPIHAYLKDSFELVLNERDPFLNKSFIPKLEIPNNQKNISEKKIEKKNPPVEKPKIVWPTVEYFGFVKNRTTSSTRCILKINQQTVQLSKGEKFAGVELIQSFSDSVILSFESIKKTFFKD